MKNTKARGGNGAGEKKENGAVSNKMKEKGKREKWLLGKNIKNEDLGRREEEGKPFSPFYIFPTPSFFSPTIPTTVEFSREKYNGFTKPVDWLKTPSNGVKTHLLKLKT